jgi:mevalonate kinase
MSNYYSNGKLLIAAEYLVMIGAEGLAIPTKFGQDLSVTENSGDLLVWESYDCEGKRWFRAEFDFLKSRIISADCVSENEGSTEMWAETLFNIFQKLSELNPDVKNHLSGKRMRTQLSFPLNWGLGSSSTLINNLANWAGVSAFELQNRTFGGSGYDVACAQNDSPILFQLTEGSPKISKVDFNPNFGDQLYFIHLNKKQDSRMAISKFKERSGRWEPEINKISEISRNMIQCASLRTFEELMVEHERLMSNILQIKTVQKVLFPDYFGQTKSLGAWGGDFILATGNEDSPEYFKKKGYTTIVPFLEMKL